MENDRRDGVHPASGRWLPIKETTCCWMESNSFFLESPQRGDTVVSCKRFVKRSHASLVVVARKCVVHRMVEEEKTKASPCCCNRTTSMVATASCLIVFFFFFGRNNFCCLQWFRRSKMLRVVHNNTMIWWLLLAYYCIILLLSPVGFFSFDPNIIVLAFSFLQSHWHSHEYRTVHLQFDPYSIAAPRRNAKNAVLFRLCQSLVCTGTYVVRSRSPL